MPPWVEQTPTNFVYVIRQAFQNSKGVMLSSSNAKHFEMKHKNVKAIIEIAMLLFCTNVCVIKHMP